MNSRKIFFTAILAGACLFVTTASSAQAAPAASAAPGASGKIGVINVRQAIVTTSEGKQASAELHGTSPRQTELENLNKQIADLRRGFRPVTEN